MNDNKTIWSAVAIFGLIVVCILGALAPVIEGGFSVGNWIVLALVVLSLIANGILLAKVVSLKKSRQQPARNTSEHPLPLSDGYMEYASGIRHGNVPIYPTEAISGLPFTVDDLTLSDNLEASLTPQQREFWADYWSHQSANARPVPLDGIGRASGVAATAAAVLAAMGPARAVPPRQIQFRDRSRALVDSDFHLGSVRGHSADAFRYAQAGRIYVQIVELGRIGRLEEEVEQGGTLYYVVSMDGKTYLYRSDECRKLEEGDIL